MSDAAAKAAFGKYFASWTRIEPRSRRADFASGLEARCADPLWFIGRAWQWGELRGEDAGTPVEAEVTHRSIHMGPVASGTHVLAEDESLAAPLEVIVEREAIPWDWRQRVTVGQHFERLVRARFPGDGASIVERWREGLPITVPAGDDLVDLDAVSRRFVELMAGRVVDGEALLTSPPDGFPVEWTDGLTVAHTDVLGVIEDVRGWYGRIYSQPTPAGTNATWVPNQLEYRFVVAAPTGTADPVELEASSYRNGALDWDTFAATLPSVEWETAAPSQVLRPTRVGFGGMPHPRWWAFEDSRVDFGAMDVARPDVAKLALMEFALIYGNDWFVLPLDVPFGSVTWIESLSVKDVFGQSQIVPRASTRGATATQRWEMFQPSTSRDPDATSAPVLVVPPVLPYREESAALEEVRFIHDEGANMVWAIEHTVTNAMGDPVDGFAAQMQRRAREGPGAVIVTPPSFASRVFRLATKVPETWIPFMPVNTQLISAASGGRSVHLVRAVMLRNDPTGLAEPIPSHTLVLGDPSAEPDPGAPAPLIQLSEEAVGRHGVRVLLTRQRARWYDGRTFVWQGRAVRLGQGEGRSGLRFDNVQQS